VTEAVRTTTRDIARSAVRAQLAQAAFDLFRREGFDTVTVTDLAEAAGVSRSTFLRYFGTKEDAVLVAFDAQGDKVADALRKRPASEDEWTALRRALDTVIAPYHENSASTLDLTRLILDTPALCSRYLEKQQAWRPALAHALAERAGRPQSVTLTQAVRAAAALECLNVAVDRWADSEGGLDLVDLLDQAFAVLASR
jgi:AcrR family transcriptional regulator